MASGSLRGLAQESVRAGAAGDSRLRASTAVLTDSPSGAITWRCNTFLVKCRQQGFMVLLPDLALVAETFQAFEESGAEEAVVMSQVAVQLETNRHRVLGDCTAILADVPWSYLPLFRKHGARVSVPTHGFSVEGTMGRPVLASVEEAAQSWIHEVLDLPIADEYFTAFELDGDPDIDAEPAPSTAAPAADSAAEVAELKKRLAQLEQLLPQSTAQAGSTAVVPAAASGLLFAQPKAGASLSHTEIQRLQAAAGPPPKRLGRAERAPIAAVTAEAELEQMVAAEADREVGEEALEIDPIMSNVEAAMQQTSDPVQRMLIAQLHQTNMLVKAIAPRAQQDPLTAVLSGSDNGAANSGSGVTVKGYAAREMFLKQLVDDRKLVNVIKHHACQELGLPEEKADGSLLRTFLEHRIPLADRKSLIQFGYILAWGWESGHRTNNVQLMAFAGRMMMYVEQCALDDGRSTLGWLMTGLPEPNFQQLSLNRKRTTLTPFSKLAPPTWVAANIGYLRDVEVFETRLKQLNPGKGPAPAARDSDTEDKPSRAKAKAKAKRQKGGKGAEAPPAETPN